VSFNSNGGTTVGSQTVDYNTTATRPEDPTKGGYNFAGWYADAGLAMPFDFGAAITSNTTLYAKWTLPLQSTITTNDTLVITTFTEGSGTWTVPEGVSAVDVLVVGGGGAGLGFGGGGGGGGFHETLAYPVTPGSNIAVAVGAGGAGGESRQGWYDGTSWQAKSGDASEFDAVTVTGGQGGHWSWVTSAGQGGASGTGFTAEAISNNYGSGSGAGAKGTANGSNSDAGGAGLSSAITGTTTWYGGGGGAIVNGPGGQGGGGAGGNPAVAGLANSGGGGGGGWGVPGAAGGSGVVIVVYQTGGQTPYQKWAAGTFAHAFTDTDPAHDPDGDGRTNQYEFAFGLDPTTGASADPISVPYDKSTHKFRYTRLKDSGLTYTVWVSTDLQDWGVAPAAASAEIVATVNDVETVEVTLTSPPESDKLFVRVKAQ
jgi:uncharacterized repeat protein (TIGR02543 family)